MSTTVTYLKSLQDKVFKLLPMREAYDSGEDNRLYEYIDNLLSNYMGAFVCYPEFGEKRILIEVQNNIAFLQSDRDINFQKWRATVLRSTRLIGKVIDEYLEV